MAYRQQLRLIIPQSGPITCIKTSLFMQKSRTSVSVLILACLGTFLRRAIYPKQSPFLQAQTILLRPYTTLYATNCPSATMQKQLPISPSFMMYFSAGRRRSSRFQNSLVRSYMSKSLKNSIFYTRDWHQFILSIILLRKTRLNSCRSSSKSFPAVRAVIVDALGWLQSSANSPKNSPGQYSFKIYAWPCFSHLKVPYWTMQRMSPSSPSLMTTSACSNVLNLALAMSLRRLSWLRCSKKMHFLRQSSSLIFVYQDQVVSLRLSVQLSTKLNDWVLSPDTPFLIRRFPLSLFLLRYWNTSSDYSSLKSSLGSLFLV